MSLVRAKKQLGQHFLTDKNIAEKIVNSLQLSESVHHVLEVGPGMGILSDFLFQQKAFETYLIDIDTESIAFLHKKYPEVGSRIISGDFLAYDFSTITEGQLGIIGNFPYNISSQILFKVLDNRQHVQQVVGMFQKEVGERLAAGHGSKVYGITSVLTQAYYDAAYLFTVSEGSFNPPPKVKSGVIRLVRRADPPAVPYGQLAAVVKTAFNQRRKTLRNALKSLPLYSEDALAPWADRRAEQLSVAEFVELTERLYRGS